MADSANITATSSTSGGGGLGVSSPYLAYAQLAASAVSGLISAYGAKSVAKYQNAALQSQANIAAINADIMERKYQSTLRASESQILRQTMQAGKVKHSQRAALAANGIAVGEGSAAELQASTDIVKTLDTNTLKKSALSEAWGYRWREQQYKNQQTAALASQKDTSAAFKSSLFSTASQVGFNYAKLYSQGAFGSTTSGGMGDSANTATAAQNYYDIDPESWNALL